MKVRYRVRRRDACGYECERPDLVQLAVRNLAEQQPCCGGAPVAEPLVMHDEIDQTVRAAETEPQPLRIERGYRLRIFLRDNTGCCGRCGVLRCAAATGQ